MAFYQIAPCMMKNSLRLLSCAIILLLSTSFNTERPGHSRKAAIKTIIVDPGHGGYAIGAKGHYSLEKNVCLAIALKLGKKLEEAFPDVKIVYTRTTDTYVANRYRADFANANKGDLYLCIHANSMDKIRHQKFTGYKKEVYYTGTGSKRKKKTRTVPKYTYYYTDDPAYGTETYIWAADRTDPKSEYIGERISGETLDSTEQAPDINDPEFRAKSLLWTKKFFDRSMLLATYVENEFVKDKRFSRGVQQRNWEGIWVLQATAMPSILVETGFLSNRKEEDYLNSKKGQEEVSDCVLRAVQRYKEE